jgi:hypothetical protein
VRLAVFFLSLPQEGEERRRGAGVGSPAMHLESGWEKFSFESKNADESVRRGMRFCRRLADPGPGGEQGFDREEIEDSR